MVTKVKVSTVVANQLPAHFASAESELSQLLKTYYQWLELSGNPLDNANNIYDNFYLESADEGFLKFFTQRIIPNIPQDALIDKKLIAKHARNFYQSKGSEDSFKFLFQAIYGKPVSLYYPKNDLFRTSSASWIGVNTIKVYTPDTNITKIAGRKLIGQVTKATCIIESILPYQTHYILTVSNPQGLFDIDEVLVTEVSNGQPTVYCRTLGHVNVARVTAQGTGYVLGDILTTAGGNGQDFIAQITQVGSLGEIQQVTIINSGFGYTVAPVLLGAPNGLGASIQFYTGSMLSVNQFKDDTDFLSSTKKLQDGEYYQEFSYVVRSSISSLIYDLVVDSLIHPAGTRRFAESTPDFSANNVLKLLFPFSDINDPKLVGTDIFHRFYELVVQLLHTPPVVSLPLSTPITNLVRQTHPESLTPISKYSELYHFFDLLNMIKAYGTSSTIADYALDQILQYQNDPIYTLNRRLLKTLIEIKIDEVLVQVPPLVGAHLILEGFKERLYELFPTVGSYTGNPLVSLLRQLKPDSLTPIGRDLVKVVVDHTTLVSAIGKLDIIQPFYNATISDYGTVQIQNMFSRSVVYTSLTTGVYP